MCDMRKRVTLATIMQKDVYDHRQIDHRQLLN